MSELCQGWQQNQANWVHLFLPCFLSGSGHAAGVDVVAFK